MLFVHSAAWVLRLYGAQALIACRWRWNVSLVFYLQDGCDVIYAFVDKDHKKQMVQERTVWDRCRQMSMSILSQCDNAMIKYDDF